jgi:signal transduction histidine kinase
MNTQAMRVYEMIADMMLFARPPQPHLAQVNVSQLLDEVIRQMQPAAERQETMLRISPRRVPMRSIGRGEGPGVRVAGEVQNSGFRVQDSPSDIPHSALRIPHSLEITADPVQLTVALKALVQNSLEALGSGGHVELELRASAAEVEILVRDDGPGIPVEIRPHLFDPFYSARQAGRGLGLGLCKAWRIVANHGGRISLESPPGPGVLFSIILPHENNFAISPENMRVEK